MLARASSATPGDRSLRRRIAGILADEKGGILAFVAVSLVMMLASTGLAVDLGRGYVERLRLGRAVDAGALAGARTLRTGQSTAMGEAQAVAAVNGVIGGVDVSTSIRFGVNARGENTVTMTASRTIPTTFMRVLGHQDMAIAASATAAVPPIDLVLTLDQSGSLARTGSWRSLQQAARAFVTYFNDSIDQLGLVSFQVAATDRVVIRHGFSGPITTAINAMNAAGDTNMGEGLRLALSQMQQPTVRTTSQKVVVFFTDGRPTALRAPVGPSGSPVDRVIATHSSSLGLVRGYFDNPDQIPLDAPATPDGCANQPTCFGWDEGIVRTQAQLAGLSTADQIRSRGIMIYVIALGDPTATDPLLTPDLAYLRRIANESGIENASQPEGRMFFAPSSAELGRVFDLVAQDLVVRLSS